VVVKMNFRNPRFVKYGVAMLLVIAGAVVCGRAYLEKVRYRAFVAEREAVMIRLDEVQKMYRMRGDLIEKWSASTSRNFQSEVAVLMSEVKGLDMKSLIEMRRLEFVHERLTALENDWSLNSKWKLAKPAHLATLSNQIDRARREYSHLALSLNAKAKLCRACERLTVPVFLVEERNFTTGRL